MGGIIHSFSWLPQQYRFLNQFPSSLLFQIRDWLTVLESMLKQQVAVVGEADDVLQLLEKQKVSSNNYSLSLAYNFQLQRGVAYPS